MIFCVVVVATERISRDVFCEVTQVDDDDDKEDEDDEVMMGWWKNLWTVFKNVPNIITKARPCLNKIIAMQKFVIYLKN